MITLRWRTDALGRRVGQVEDVADDTLALTWIRTGHAVRVRRRKGSGFRRSRLRSNKRGELYSAPVDREVRYDDVVKR